MTAKCASLRRLILVSKSGMKLWYNCIRASPAWKTMRNKKLWVGWVWVLGVEGKKKRKRNKEADDQRRRHRSDSSADRMSRGRRSDFALCSDAGAVQSPDWEIRYRTVAEPNRYQVLSFLFYLLIYLFMKLIKRRRMVWVWLKKKKKKAKRCVLC